MLKVVQDLMRALWQVHPTWRSPRIVGELRKLGLNVATSTVEKSHPRIRKPSSPTWKTFLTHHVHDIVACDFFLSQPPPFACSLSSSCSRMSAVALCIATSPNTLRRRGPPSRSSRHCPGIPRRDISYGTETRSTAPHANHGSRTWVEKRSRVRSTALGSIPDCERLIGTIRRERLDHVIVLTARHLRRVLTASISSDHRCRTPLSLAMDCPQPRAVRATGSREGKRPA